MMQNDAMPMAKVTTRRMDSFNVVPLIVATEAPHMQLIMNMEKMTPCGGGTTLLSRAGVQLYTNANIEPSKHDTMTAISTMFTSVARSLHEIARFSVMVMLPESLL